MFSEWGQTIKWCKDKIYGIQQAPATSQYHISRKNQSTFPLSKKRSLNGRDSEIPPLTALRLRSSLKKKIKRLFKRQSLKPLLVIYSVMQRYKTTAKIKLQPYGEKIKIIIKPKIPRIRKVKFQQLLIVQSKTRDAPTLYKLVQVYVVLEVLTVISNNLTVS